jgi:hypothetical protein
MKKEYIKPFAKVKEVEMVVMTVASMLIDVTATEQDPSGAHAKEFFDFLLEE